MKSSNVKDSQTLESAEVLSSPRLARRVVGQSIASGLALFMRAGVEAAAAPPPEIVVTGEVSKETIGIAKVPTPIVDTPFSISTVDADELRRRGVTTLTDALRAVPGISLGAGETSWQGNNLILRGFTTRNDTFLDGMRDYGYYFRDPFNDASVEVLKGPSSVLFGRGATGGVIHQVSKQPELAPRIDGELSLGSDNTRRLTADVDVPLGAAIAVRFDTMAHRSEVADRDGARSRRWGIAPAMGLGIGTPTRLTLSFFHQREKNRPDYGIPWFNGAPAAVPRDTYYGFADDYLDTRVDVGTARFEHDLSAAATIRAQLRYSRDDRAFRTSEAVIATGISATTPLDTLTVTRNEFSGTSRDRFLQAQVDTTVRFATGPLRHILVTGVEAGQERPEPIYIFHVGVIGTRLTDPLVQTFAETNEYVRLSAVSHAATLGLFVLDNIALGMHWHALVGMRWDRFDVHYRSIGYSPGGTTIATTDIRREDHRASGRVALIYKPDADTSLYVSWANSFNPSAEGIESLVSAGRSVAQANLNAKPETSRIVEAGAKRTVLGDRLLLTGAIFRTIKSNVRIPDPAVTGFNTNGGRQRVQGFELEASGRVTTRWWIRASYAFLDSETRSTDNPGAGGSPRIGEALTITPRHSASLQTGYDLADWLAIGLGVMYQSSRLGQNTNASLLRAPGYVTYDLRARWRLSPRLALQVNLLNLTDKLYYDQLHPFHVVPGAGRSVLVSLIAAGL